MSIYFLYNFQYLISSASKIKTSTAHIIRRKIQLTTKSIERLQTNICKIYIYAMMSTFLYLAVKVSCSFRVLVFGFFSSAMSRFF